MSERAADTTQLEITDIPTDAQPEDTADLPQDLESARQEALEGGARYRHVARDTSDSRPTRDNRCSCGNHVSNDWVRVFGVQGSVDGCPECSSLHEIMALGGDQ